VKEQNRKIEKFISKLCKNEKVSIKELRSGSRRKGVSRVRDLIATGLVKKHGVALAEIAGRVGVDRDISKIVKRASQ
jgi:chromosomal replication initiation ATPase DnaA